MKTRSFLFAAVASVAIGFTYLPAFAEPETTPSDIENSKFTFAGEVNADGTLIRSGPSESDYAAMKLDKGAKITVVGMRFDWLKVIPPEGSFCLVPQAYIERSGDGSIGKVGSNPATVRIGSSLTQQKHKVPLRLEPGASVKILGQVDEFYKIAPPPNVYLFVDKKFVNPVKRLDETTPSQPTDTVVTNAPTDATPTNTETTDSTSTDTAATRKQTRARPIPKADSSRVRMARSHSFRRISVRLP
ncbi:MAG TPA: hypothetical protein PK402_04905 [Tepidisphaeraceae bacterium]|nr:hypothetical protein [Tepidisphaeraceae bacterium]